MRIFLLLGEVEVGTFHHAGGTPPENAAQQPACRLSQCGLEYCHFLHLQHRRLSGAFSVFQDGSANYTTKYYATPYCDDLRYCAVLHQTLRPLSPQWRQAGSTATGVNRLETHLCNRLRMMEKQYEYAACRLLSDCFSPWGTHRRSHEAHSAIECNCASRACWSCYTVQSRGKTSQDPWR